MVKISRSDQSRNVRSELNMCSWIYCQMAPVVSLAGWERLQQQGPFLLLPQHWYFSSSISIFDILFFRELLTGAVKTLLGSGWEKSRTSVAGKGYFMAPSWCSFVLVEPCKYRLGECDVHFLCVTDPNALKASHPSQIKLIDADSKISD